MNNTGTDQPTTIDVSFKAFAADQEGRISDEVPRLGLHALDGDLQMPVMVLKRSALRHNIETMARFCSRNGVSLAPHGKTTMSPELVARQIEAGAWGVTVATVAQARVFAASGVRNIIIASQVVDPAGLRWISLAQAADPGLFLVVLVDSVQGVQCMGELIAAHPRPHSVAVLLEVGYEGGRGGARTVQDAMHVAHAVHDAEHLSLVGVEGFEGMMPGGSMAERKDLVATYLATARTVAELCRANGLFDVGRLDDSRPIITFGGSAFHDVVVDGLAGVRAREAGVRMVLRSGCYVTHDDGLYAETSPWASGSHALRPAIEVWGAVLSTPEPGLAIVGIGRRDVGSDSGMPAALWVRRGGVSSTAHGLTIIRLNDQHAYVSVSREADIQVGDLMGCGISHPCTTFDKWSLIPEIDDDYGVVGTVRTYF